MPSFEEKKGQYLDKLREDPMIIEALFKEKKDPRILELIIDPKDDRELEVAELMFVTMKKMSEIAEAAIEDTLKVIHVEENYAIQFLEDLVNAVIEDDEEKTKEILKRLEDPKVAAKYVYHLTAGTLSDLEGTVDKANEVMENGDLSDPVKKAKFELFMLKVKEKTNKNSDITSALTDEGIGYLRVYTDEFLRLCDEGIIKEELETDIHKEYTKDKDDDTLY